MSSAFTMSTPAAIRVESVRDQRAIETLRTTAPIVKGVLSLNRSQIWRPPSVFFQRMKPKMIRPTSGKTMNQ